MLIERWMTNMPSMLSSMCQHGPRLQFASCAEKDSLCRIVMIHDGLNLRCLDQCHGVRSQGKGSSQSWRKELLCSLNLIDTSLFSVIYAGLLGKAFPRKHAFVDISVFLWFGTTAKIRPSASPRSIFECKELDIELDKALIAQMNAWWRKLNTNMHQ